MQVHTRKPAGFSLSVGLVKSKIMLLEKIKTLANNYAPEFIEARHHLHAHPELSYKEFETSKFVQQKLTEFGIPFEIKATTGVIGLIEGKNPSKRIIALRADMDALPIKE